MNELFFYSSKIIWNIISPDSLFVILLSISLLLILFKRKRQGTILLFILTSSLLFLSFFHVGNWMLYPLESRFQHNPVLPDRIDGIFVLGGSVIPETSAEWQQLETNGTHERLSSFIQLANQYPEAKLIFSGGNGSLDTGRPSEAETVKNYFLKSGISEQRLIMEDKARNTAENVSLSKQLLNPQPDENWIIITTAFHMPRTVGIFCQQNWRVIPYPVDHQTIPGELYTPNFNLIGHANNLILAAHEWTGLLAYFLTGKIPRLIPDQCSNS